MERSDHNTGSQNDYSEEKTVQSVEQHNYMTHARNIVTIRDEQGRVIQNDRRLIAVITAAVMAFEGNDGFVVRSIRRHPRTGWRN